MFFGILICGYIVINATYILFNSFMEDVTPVPRGRKRHG